ncbi:MAG: glycosyltransferase involved in cell wall biosynthesis [Flavobacteriaceae bacterium]|jgi:glycosyltransferase involved in cell wall biosynthesis|uniref:glycosyltransferase n=1 Tax=Candidatus Marifrigoribacter sp. Uisw_064 TaxID=3230970 RepID=UPI003ADB6299
MNPQKILFIYRKPNKGNFSIEKVYNSIFNGMKIFPGNSFTIKKKTLKKNYDFTAFLFSFISSLFSKKYIVHITGGCNYMVLAFPFKNRVLTIHDLFHFKKNKNIKGYIYDVLYYHLPIRFSNEVIVVSDNTKQEMLKHFSIDKNKVTVINNPLVIASKDITYREREFKKTSPIKIIQIGDKPLKNYRRLIEATKDLNVYYNFVHANDIIIKKLIKDNGIQERAAVHKGITDKELYNLYDKSDVLFFASEAEGFGLPIIEAQAFGLQVITSNRSPMDVVGKDAILIDPMDVNAIKSGFLSLYDDSLIKENSNKAKQNIMIYELENIVTTYINFYNSCA